MRPPSIPRWQTRLLQVSLAAIVLAVLAALVIAPSVLRRNMETVDTSALRSELFDLHLGIDAFRVAVVEWQDAQLKGTSEDRAALQLEERGQLLLHRLGVLLAHPGLEKLIPESADTIRRTRERLDVAMSRLSGPEPRAAAALSQLARMRTTDILSLDRDVIDGFTRLGRILSSERWRVTQAGIIGQRLSAFLIVISILTLVILWMQRRVLRQASSSLETAMEDLAEAQRIAHIGNLRRNHARDEITWSDEFARIFGLAPGGRMTVAEFDALIHPADRDKVAAAETGAAARSAESGRPEPMDMTFSAYRSDGAVIELEAHSEIVADAEGKPVSAVATLRDITEEARARRALRDSQRNLAAAQRIARLGSFRRNYKTERIVWSHELYFLLGRDPANGPVPLRRIVHPEDHARVEELFADLLDNGVKGGQRQLNYECRVLRKDGTQRWVRGTAEMSYDDQGQPEVLTGSLQDVTKEIAQQRALRDALDRAERANSAKSEFLAIMSHELRTPMNGILGMLAAIEAQLEDGTRREQIRIAQSSAKALLVILNDVLDMSKIEAGRLELEPAPFDLGALVRGTIDLYAETARSKGIALSAHMDEALPRWLHGDGPRIRQILANIVSNAVKFTQDGRVELSVTRQDEDKGEAAPGSMVALRFRVTDDGIGIPLDKQDQLFGRFNQLDASYSRRFGGTGLGLAISRSLAELMGGRMDFSSKPGAGSSFWLDVVLPVAEPLAGTDRVGAEAPLPSMRILVAEDNATNRVVARVLLEQLGQRLAFAANGAEAVRAAQAESFDLILMDISMPVMDGMEATRQIRALKGGSARLPILALTAHAGRAEQDACLAAGCNEVLTKPLDPAALRAALHRWSGHLPPALPTPAPRGGDAPLAKEADGEIDMRLAELASQIGEEALPDLIAASLDDLARHRGVLDALSRGEAVGPDVARRTFHSLAGIAATFGAAELTALARGQEREAQADPGSAAFQDLRDGIRLFEQALRQRSAISSTTTSLVQEGS
ncbi:hybrid sensor histidine kinase/response regulator [Paracoccus chinensis]|uniref:histidine kinase n=1 Tax=Paracoccus chinensis TaxID=525640 RepID=A0A1G9LCQ8_9RHOB|nr:ATP-binding protein [Paracoccus chinensis]SDL59553.1 PAS domain S-box-containing protein [Paracoccus chinensis]